MTATSNGVAAPEHLPTSGFHPDDDTARIFASCTRFLSFHYAHDPVDLVAAFDRAGFLGKHFGQFGADSSVRALEERIAELLGKKAALFFPTGTMAQLVALRIWQERSGCDAVAWHPTAHMNSGEGEQGYAFVLGLKAAQLGHPLEVTRYADFARYPSRLGAIVLETPLRQLGGKLVPWDDLVSIAAWARARSTAVHFDGARLFETGPGYGRSYTEICRHADSVFVSTYKVVGGFGGAVLAGDPDFIAEAAVWRRRFGGDLYRVFPYAVTSLLGLDERLMRIERYAQKACAIARVLRRFPEVVVTPDPPEACMMHVSVRSGGSGRLKAAALEVSRETGVWLFHGTRTSRMHGYELFELTVGDATLDISDDEIGELFTRLLERLR